MPDRWLLSDDRAAEGYAQRVGKVGLGELILKVPSGTLSLCCL